MWSKMAELGVFGAKVALVSGVGYVAAKGSGWLYGKLKAYLASREESDAETETETGPATETA